MANNNHAGMHFIYFASDTTAVHEFDYDNMLGSRIRVQKSIGGKASQGRGKSFPAKCAGRGGKEGTEVKKEHGFIVLKTREQKIKVKKYYVAL